MSLTRRATGMPAQQPPPSRAELRKQLAERLMQMEIARPTKVVDRTHKVP